MSDSFLEQLKADSWFLKSDRRLDTELVDKIILQLNRIHPQILTDKEATKFRDLDVPTCLRLAELLTHLQEKGEEACREFYRALHLHVEEVYYSLPTRLRRRRESADPVLRPAFRPTERYTLNQQGELQSLLKTRDTRDSVHPVYYTDLSLSLSLSLTAGPLFFLSCFSAAVGAALLYYYGDVKAVSGSSSALGFAALRFGRKIREVLIWYTDDGRGR
ncbi:caspase recruitment domain family, member 19 isoform X1 [Hemibagrus wyckioides]|uniref:caspase recruitment domain family, member 19 isoform X1 n=1 Tax=Hemibagrus wyckioides TaxID=337641 RepID=UPI00266DAC75|nr:caspase recruitment domain family, member 19 isoform X1 [Hemibagrus wyckioides]